MKWRCTVCNYIHEGDNPPDVCPVCGVGAELFIEITDNTNGDQTKEQSSTDVRQLKVSTNPKKWRCTVCNYVHYGDQPPEKCPECGVGPEFFVEVTEAGTANRATVRQPATQPRKWRCTVCNYIHYGDKPPDVCPECGVGPEMFEEVAGDEATQQQTIQGGTQVQDLPAIPVKFNPDYAAIQTAMFKISYGLYIIGSRYQNKINAQCSNTIVQLTSDPPTVGLCLNKHSLTHDFIMQSHVFSASILGVEDIDAVKRFGFSSGRDVDKFEHEQYLIGETGCPVLTNCAAYIEAVVRPDKIIDLGTHTLFVADVVNTKVVNQQMELLTYDLYRKNRK